MISDVMQKSATDSTEEQKANKQYNIQTLKKNLREIISDFEGSLDNKKPTRVSDPELANRPLHTLARNRELVASRENLRAALIDSIKKKKNMGSLDNLRPDSTMEKERAVSEVHIATAKVAKAELSEPEKKAKSVELPAKNDIPEPPPIPMAPLPPPSAPSAPPVPGPPIPAPVLIPPPPPPDLKIPKAPLRVTSFN